MAKQQHKKAANKPPLENKEMKSLDVKVNLLGNEYEIKALLLLAVVVLLVYVRAVFGELTNWDDQVYVTHNKLIIGLNGSQLKAIFTQGQVGNYHPLTMLSYAIEHRLFGLNAKVFHLTNIIIHTATTLLVFRFARLLRFGIEAAFLIAAIFALHPMHVESVAWVSERKDVLYGFFYMASLVYYAKHATNKDTHHWRYYAFSMVLFACALLSKGQAVSLSILLLAVDYYLARGWSKQVWLEKLPFFAMSLLMGIVAIKVQQSFGYMGALQIYSLHDRLFYAAYGLLLYIGKFFLPVKLACFIPFPGKLDALIYLSPFILIILALFVYRSVKSNRAVLFGSLFFLGSIVMVLQILPVGGALLSERYSYIPYIGLAIIMGYEFEVLLKTQHQYKNTLYWGVALLLIVFGMASFNRIAVWHNNVALWTDAIAKYPSAVAYNNRGTHYKGEKKKVEALADFNSALQIMPDYYEALVARGELLREAGQVDAAFIDLDKAIHLNPKPEYSAYMNRAVVYCMKNQLDKAKQDFDSAESKNNTVPELYSNFGNYWDMTGNYAKAMECYNKAIVLDAKFENAYINRATSYCRQKKYTLALQDFNTALTLNPKLQDAYMFRSYVYKDLERYAEALRDILQAQMLGATIDVNYVTQLQQKMSAK